MSGRRHCLIRGIKAGILQRRASQQATEASINKLLHAHSYSIEERTGEPRCPLCSSQHTHTSARKVVTMSTQLRDCEVGYGSKTKLGRSSAIRKLKATCTSCMHTTTNCRTLKHTTNHKIKQRLQAAGYERKKKRNKPDAVYKCPVCCEHHSCTRNNQQGDCKEVCIRMSSPDNAATLKKVKGRTRCTNRKHTADSCSVQIKRVTFLVPQKKIL